MGKFDAAKLSMFTGTEHYYRHTRHAVLTDGTKYLAEGLCKYMGGKHPCDYTKYLPTKNGND